MKGYAYSLLSVDVLRLRDIKGRYSEVRMKEKLGYLRNIALKHQEVTDTDQMLMLMLMVF